MTERLAWKAGTGRYSGGDTSTYFVTDDDGGFVAVFVAGSTIGRGKNTRTVGQRGTELVVEASYGVDGLPEVVLTNEMKGWWESSGKVVFSATEPAVIGTEARPREERPRHGARRSLSFTGSDAPEMLTGVAMTPAAPGTQELPPELPGMAKGLVRKLLEEWRVRRGPAGIVLLAADGTVIAPDDKPELFGGYLQSKYRHLFLRELRTAQAARDLESVPYTKFTGTAYARPAASHEEPGWYWCTGNGADRFIGGRYDVVRFSPLAQRSKGHNRSVNYSAAPALHVLGALTATEFVFPRSPEATEVLVVCPRGSVREVTLLLATQPTLPGAMCTNLALVSYTVAHGRRGEVLLEPPASAYIRDYVLAVDNKGGGRIFNRF